MRQLRITRRVTPESTDTLQCAFYQRKFPAFARRRALSSLDLGEASFNANPCNPGNYDGADNLLFDIYCVKGSVLKTVKVSCKNRPVCKS